MIIEGEIVKMLKEMLPKNIEVWVNEYMEIHVQMIEMHQNWKDWEYYPGKKGLEASLHKKMTKKRTLLDSVLKKAIFLTKYGCFCPTPRKGTLRGV